MYLKQLFTAGALLSLVACAASGPDYYRAAERPGDYGYSEVRLDDDHYRVSFTGDTSMSEESVRELALLRAAELTRQERYDWFRIVEEESEQSARVVRRGPDSDVTIVSDEDAVTVVERGDDPALRRECDPLGCTTTISPGYQGPNVVTVRQADRFSTTVEIEMGNGDVINPSTVYNATALYDYLDDRYSS